MRFLVKKKRSFQLNIINKILMAYYFIILIFSFFLSNAFYKKFISNSSKKFLDIPNNRSMHVKPIPRGAGIVFILITNLSSIIYFLIFGFNKIYLIPLVILPLSIVGLFDDLYSLKPITKYIFQFLVSLLIVLFSNLFINLNFVFYFIIIFLFTGIVNFINFMDGIDGIVGSCMLIAITTSCIILQIDQNYLFLIGSLASFIVWNWYPAKLFMGDIGSTFLAAINIGIISQSNSYIQALGLLLVLGPCLVDPFTCVIRRFSNGEKIFKAHKLHLYQRIKLSGIRQDKVSMIYILFTFILSLSNIFLDIEFTIVAFLIACLFGFYLDQKIAKPFLKALNNN